MAKKELKWYGIFVVLFGAILSIADPITDVLTLVEFYRTDHKTWFVVGLTFIILPSLSFLVIKYMEKENTLIYYEEYQSKVCKFTHILVVGCNPLYPAWLKLQTLYCYLKLRRGNNTNQTDKDLDDLLWFSKIAVLAEVSFESAPQFIIQLYAMAVQQQSVSIIQMVSLPVSFLSITWAFTVGDKFLHYDHGWLNFSFKEAVLLFVTHLFILSSRLFAVALFTVSYKWWVTGVLILHCTVITICHRVWLYRVHCHSSGRRRSVIVFCLHWLRDDLYNDSLGESNLPIMQLVSNVLFVIENITMILLFYFSHFPHPWYSLPVTICVCLFAVLGAVMRLTHFYYSQRRNQSESRSRYSIERPATAAGLQQYVYETSV